MNISPKLPFVCAVLATVVALQVSIGSPSDAEAARVIRVINGRRIYIHQSTPRTGSLQKIKIGAGTQQPTFDFAKPLDRSGLNPQPLPPKSLQLMLRHPGFGR